MTGTHAPQVSVRRSRERAVGVLHAPKVRLTLIVALAVVVTGQAPLVSAQSTVELVRDIAPGVANSRVSWIATDGTTLYFAADDHEHGSELWVSSGTEASTVLLADILPGPDGSSPGQLTVVGDLLFFTAYVNPRGSGSELWATDGTEAGTSIVRDILPGRGSSYSFYLTPLEDRLFFVAQDRTHGFEPWTSDGTEAGTMMIRDINPGNPWGFQLDVPEIARVGGSVFFAADDGVHGIELWRSDGTEAGTALVKDIATGAEDSLPHSLLPAGDRLYFKANDGAHGYELWVTDGSSDGTFMVADIRPGPRSAHPAMLAFRDGIVFVAAKDGIHGTELWRSDGTPDGTWMVKDINPSHGGALNSWMVEVGGALLFLARDGTHGIELWTTDGTEAGTLPVTTGLPIDFVWGPFVMGDTLFFRASDDDHGAELWSSDGTAVGTGLVVDLYEGRRSSWPDWLAELEGALYFQARSAETGGELWRLAV